MIYDLRFLSNVVSRGLMQAAEAYLSEVRVDQVRIADDGAKVDGALTHRKSGQHERVFITVRNRPKPELRMDCSCEASGACVHGVALLLASLGVPGAAVEPPPPPPVTGPRIHYRMEAMDQWPPRLIFSLSIENSERQMVPLTLSLAWLQLQRTRLSDVDWRILQRLRELDGGWENRARHEFKAAHIAGLLPTLLETGRCFWADHETPLISGFEREGSLRWTPRDNGQQVLELHCQGAQVFPALPPFYIDAHANSGGLVLCNANAEAMRWAERGVVVQGGDYTLFMQRHREDMERAGLPLPVDYPIQDTQPSLSPSLRFYSARTHVIAQQSYRRPALIDAIRVSFRYEGPQGHVDFMAEAPNQVQYLFRKGVLYRFSRQRPIEQRWMEKLEKALPKLTALEHVYQGMQFTDGVLPGDLCVTTAQEWQKLLLEQIPRLRKDGWHIHISSNFRHHFVDSREWRVRLDKDTSGKLSIALQTQIDGSTYGLLPRLLAEINATPERYARESLLAHHETVLTVGDDRRVLVPASILKTLLRHLVELFDQPKLDKTGRLLLPATQLQRMHALAEELGSAWFDPQHQLDAPPTLETPPTDAPLEGLNAQLRDYQWQGVMWLRHLAERRMGGILADDMGLGKTLQTLTFLLMEKNEGRMRHPALVVAPTSVLHNWLIEAGKFTPTLRCRMIHGPQRASAFEHRGEVDLFITSYSLAHRDLAHWEKMPLSFLMLDEAHMIKNANTKVAKALREFNTEHRFCLTGTPLENHLGELWSLFDFMMPGVLGSDPQFKRLYRIPIERKRDEARAQSLLNRISPHLLRRKKVDVARELPAKTEVTVKVLMNDAQAQCYDTLHALTQQDISRILAESPLDQRRIHILDALLRLRQLCCDPRLLPDRELHDIPSAKLEHLLDMLESLVEEGHRVLVFSQFASMLQLISTALRELKLRHLMLTGATQDRQDLVNRFQGGEAPIFLISLKAGGTGLNLTKADTVIHFDPWWNPATEEQATDRAYRIGQDKPVFVYKLICQNTLEENIVSLQERKRELQQTVTETAALMAAGGLTEEDLNFLLKQPGAMAGAPLTENPP